MAENIQVSFTAEGADKIVKQLQQIADQANKTGKEGAKGFNLMKDAAQELKAVLPAIGLAIAVEKMEELVKSTIEAATAIGKLNEKTGMSAESLSALRVAAKGVDIDFDQLGKGLIKFNVNMGKLDEGSTKMGEDVKKLFGSFDALKGMDADERFKAIATQLGQMHDGFEKTKLAVDFFGKSGADLIPLFNKIGTEGFGAIEQHAKDLGLLMNNDMTRAATRVSEDFKEMQLHVEGAATTFTSTFNPALAEAIEAMNTSVSKGSTTLQDLGTMAGVVTKVIAGAFIALKFDIMGVFDGIKFVVMSTWDSVVAVIHKKNPWEAVKADFAKYQADLMRNADDFKAQMDALLKPKTPTPKADYGHGAGGDTGDESDKADKSKLDAQKKSLDAELKAFMQHNKDMETEAKQGFETGELSVQQYYDRRAALMRAAADKEIEILKKQRALIAASPVLSDDDAIKKKQEAADIDTQIAAKKLSIQSQIKANTIDEQLEERKLAEAYVAYQEKIEAAQGHRHQAAMDQIDKEAQKLDLLLKQMGLNDAQRGAVVGQFRGTEGAKADFGEAKEAAAQKLADIDLKRAQIQDKINNGSIFELQGRKELDDLLQKELPDLREKARLMTEAADKSKDPTLIQEAAKYTEQINQMAISTSEAAQYAKQFKAGLQSALTGSITQGLMDIVKGTKSVGQAFRDMAIQVIQAIEQMIIKEEVEIAVEAMMKAGGGAVHKADGGAISGPGTGTSDSIPAMLSNNEHVLTAKEVQMAGGHNAIYAMRAAIRNGGLSLAGMPRARFAEGGAVGGTAPAPMGAQQSNIHIGLEQGLVLQHMQTTEGHRVHLDVITKNRRAIRSILGV